jgi:hypothetical protein
MQKMSTVIPVERRAAANSKGGFHLFLAHSVDSWIFDR